MKAGLVSEIKYGKPAKDANRRTNPITVEQLIEVKKPVDSIGGSEQLRSALDTLEQIQEIDAS